MYILNDKLFTLDFKFNLLLIKEILLRGNYATIKQLIGYDLPYFLLKSIRKAKDFNITTLCLLSLRQLLLRLKENDSESYDYLVEMFFELDGVATLQLLMNCDNVVCKNLSNLILETNFN